MNKDTFIKLREELLEQAAEILKSKNEDYSVGRQSIDFLEFFNTGQSVGVTPMKTCGLLLKKHINAIYSYIKSEQQNESEPIEERIKDGINYLIFLHAIIKQNEVTEKIEREHPKK